MIIQQRLFLFSLSVLLSLHSVAVESLFDQAKSIYKSNPTEAISLLKEYEDLVSNDPEEVGRAKWMTGHIYSTVEKKDNLALVNYYNAVSSYIRAGNYDAVSKIYLDIGLVFLKSRSYEIARKYFHKSISHSKEKRITAANYYNLGLLSRQTLNIDSGYYYFKKSLDLNQELRNFSKVAREFNEMGILKWEQDSFNVAVDFYKRSLSFIDETKDHSLNARLMNNLGRAYISLNLLDSAEYFLQKSIRIKEVNELTDRLSFTLNNLALMSKMNGDEKAMIHYYKMSADVGQHMDQAELETVFDELISYYETKNIDSAFYYARLLNAHKQDEDQYQMIATELSKKYQLELIDSEFKYLEDERNNRQKFYWVLGGCGLIILTIGLTVLLWVRNVKRKSKDESVLNMVHGKAKFLIRLLIFENREHKATIAEYQRINKLKDPLMEVSKKPSRDR